MRKLILSILFLSTLLLFGCKIQIIPGNNNNTNTNNSSSSSSSTSTAGTETPTKDQDQLIDIGDLVVYTDGTCQLEVCSKNVVDSIIKQELKLNFNVINYVDLQTNQESSTKLIDAGLNRLPLLEFNQEQYQKVIAAIPDIKSYVKSNGDMYYLSLFVWEFGKENDCADSVDNDNDGLVDRDDDDCNKVLILADKRCDQNENQSCNLGFIEQSLSKQVFPLGYYYDTLDYNSEEGKAIYNIIKGTGDLFLPLVVVNNIQGEIKDLLLSDNAIEEVQIDANTNYLLKIIQGTFDPVEADICLSYDEQGELKASCDKEECKSLVECKPEINGKLELFVMGYCPFGELAAKALPTIQDQFKDDAIDLQIYYIVTHDGQGYKAENFSSLHGKTESEEDIRQLCVQKYYGLNNLIDYMQERYKNADNHGQVGDDPSIAIKSIGADVKVIEDCVTNGEGGQLLAKNAKRGQELGVNGSPTWYANDKYKFGGYNAGNVITNFCKHNPELNGCKGEIDVSNDTSAGGAPQCEGN